MLQFRLRAFDVARLSRWRACFCVVIGNEDPDGTTALVRDVILPALNPEEAFLAAASHVGVYGDGATPIRHPGDDIARVLKDQNRRRMAGEDNAVAVVLDGVSGAAWHSDTHLRCLAMNGRILQASMVLAANRTIQMPPMFRSQVGFAFVEKRADDLASVFRDYFGAIPEFAIFRSAMESLHDGEYLVWDAGAERPEDGVFFLRRGGAACTSLRPRTPERPDARPPRARSPGSWPR
eukprot:jgi/Tetstr1/454174/TSEL_041093.t1